MELAEALVAVASRVVETADVESLVVAPAASFRSKEAPLSMCLPTRLFGKRFPPSMIPIETV